jgi:GDP/UDP-N,N'-diacetylbacillosamine 2-epimerase (hydrolysing)
MVKMRRKVLAITGIRSEYDILYPVIKCLRDAGFEVKLVVSGAHLSPWHGETVRKIEEDGFEIADKIDTLFMTNRTTQRVKGVGILTYALSQTVEREKPDFLLVVGDREESIATALVGNYMNILTAHIGGG